MKSLLTEQALLLYTNLFTFDMIDDRIGDIH